MILRRKEPLPRPVSGFLEFDFKRGGGIQLEEGVSAQRCWIKRRECSETWTSCRANDKKSVMG